MSDDFGTVNVNRAERAREIDVLRQHYRRHRETIGKLIADAPTEHLASEYRHLIAEIDASLLKLDELEGRGSGAAPAAEPRLKTEPGMRPLVTTPAGVDEPAAYDDEAQRDSRSRLALIVVAAVIALALIGWLIWRASSDRDKPGAVAGQPSTAAPSTVSEEPPVTPAPPAATISVTPKSADYGTIRKGTRATRQFEVINDSDQPVTVQVARSACRCLFYEYVELVPPKGREGITVTIDGARAPAGTLRETVRVTGKKDPSIATSFELTATIR